MGKFCVDIQKTLIEFAKRQTDLGGFDMPYPIAMAIALDPTVATKIRSLYVTIETGSEVCRGQTVVDHQSVTSNPPNVEVVLEAVREHVDGFFGKLIQEVTRPSALYLSPQHS